VLLPFDNDLAIDEQSFRKHLSDVASVEGLSGITINAHSTEVGSCSFDEQRSILEDMIIPPATAAEANSMARNKSPLPRKTVAKKRSSSSPNRSRSTPMNHKKAKPRPRFQRICPDRKPEQ
jgi:hypothetical protein